MRDWAGQNATMDSYNASRSITDVAMHLGKKASHWKETVQKTTHTSSLVVLNCTSRSSAASVERPVIMQQFICRDPDNCEGDQHGNQPPQESKYRRSLLWWSLRKRGSGTMIHYGLGGWMSSPFQSGCRSRCQCDIYFAVRQQPHGEFKDHLIRDFSGLTECLPRQREHLTQPFHGKTNQLSSVSGIK